jgi:hypothetical protein
MSEEETQVKFHLDLLKMGKFLTFVRCDPFQIDDPIQQLNYRSTDQVC